MKKFQKLLITTLAVLLMNFANALEIVDVRSDYWAGQEIVRAIQNGYIYVIDGNKFKPEGIMTRSEFVSALLKVIQRQNNRLAPYLPNITREQLCTITIEDVHNLNY